MPSKNVPEVLVELYHTHKGAPWNFRSWQERTRIHHGLFPQNDNHLPHGWTREKANDIQSWFLEYDSIVDEKEKQKCLSKSSKPGRSSFTKWITVNWDKWGIHDDICSALRLRDCHPFLLLRNDPTIRTFPEARFHLAKVTDEVAWKLLGSAAFPRGSRTVPASYSELGFPSSLIIRSWVRLKSKWGKDKKRLETLATNAKTAYGEAVESPKPTSTALRKVIHAVAKWKELLDTYSIEQDMDEAEAMLTDLKSLLESAGVQVNTSSRSSDKRKPIKFIMASEQDINDLENLYTDLFRTPFDDELLPIDNDDDAAGNDPPDDNAIGMDLVGHLDESVVRRQLGMKSDGIPLLFHELRHKAGLTAWDNPKAFTPDIVERNTSHLHQDNGVLAALRHATTKDPKSYPVTSSILVADEVGLGKTRLMIEMMAMVIVSTICNIEQEQQPPVLKGRFLGDGSKFENLPHLWIVPMTLIPQTMNAIMGCLKPHSVDIMVYECGKRGNEDFWSKTGPFKSSKQPPINKIIITSHASLREEFSWSHQQPANKPDVPWEIPEPTRDLSKTLFGRRYATVTIDEAHEFRRTGPKFLSAFLICQQAQLRVLATGTPLHTSSSDIVSLGRLMQLPYFLSQAGLQKTKDDANMLLQLRPSAGDDRTEYLAFQIKITREYQAQLLANMIRRTAKTLNHLGKPLLPDLPPKRNIVLVLTPTEREKRITAAVAKKAKSNANTANEVGIVPTNFYLEYRMISCYAKEKLNGPAPEFSSLAEWEPIKSTKMDVAARVAAHYLSHDDIDDVFSHNGIPRYPPMPLVPAGKSPPRTRKILIYVAWTSLMPILLKVLRLYGLNYVYMDGKTPLEKRAETIRRFFDPDGPRIFVFSSIGAIGLNLTCADVVIFVDQSWSVQESDQIAARAHRYLQKKIVRCIHILIDGTADCVLSEIARSKDIMFKAFANKPLLEELRAIMSGKTVYGSDDEDDDVSDEEDDIEGLPKTARGKVRGKGRRAPAKGKGSGAPLAKSLSPSSDDEVEGPTKLIRNEKALVKAKGKGKEIPLTKSLSTHTRQGGMEHISMKYRPKELEKLQNAGSSSSRRTREPMSESDIDEEDSRGRAIITKKAERTSNMSKTKKSGETTVEKAPIINRSKMTQRAAVTIRSQKPSQNVNNDDDRSSESEWSAYNQNASPPTPITSSRESRSRLRAHKATPTSLRDGWRPAVAHGDSSDDIDFPQVESNDVPFSEGLINPDGSEVEDDEPVSDTDFEFGDLFIVPTPKKGSKAKAKALPLDEEDNGVLLDHDGDYEMMSPDAQAASTKQKSKARYYPTTDDDGDLQMSPPSDQKSKPAKADRKNEGLPSTSTRVRSTRPATSPLQERPSKRARVGWLTDLQSPPSNLPEQSSKPALSQRRREQTKAPAMPSASTSSSVADIPSIDFSRIAKHTARKSSGDTRASSSASTSILRIPSLQSSEASKSKIVGDNTRTTSSLMKEAYRQAETAMSMLVQAAEQPTPPIADRYTSTTHQKGRTKTNPFAKRSNGSHTAAPAVKNTITRPDASPPPDADQGTSTTHQQRKSNPFAKGSNAPRATDPVVKTTNSRAEAATTQRQDRSIPVSFAKDSGGSRTSAPVVKKTYGKVAQTSTATQAQSRSSSLANPVNRTASTTLPVPGRTKTVGTGSGSSSRELPPPSASRNEASSSRNEGRSSHRRSLLWENDVGDDSESDEEDVESPITTAKSKLMRWK